MNQENNALKGKPFVIALSAVAVICALLRFSCLALYYASNFKGLVGLFPILICLCNLISCFLTIALFAFLCLYAAVLYKRMRLGIGTLICGIGITVLLVFDALTAIASRFYTYQMMGTHMSPWGMVRQYLLGDLFNALIFLLCLLSVLAMIACLFFLKNSKIPVIVCGGVILLSRCVLFFPFVFNIIRLSTYNFIGLPFSIYLNWGGAFFAMLALGVFGIALLVFGICNTIPPVFRIGTKEEQDTACESQNNFESE